MTLHYEIHRMFIVKSFIHVIPTGFEPVLTSYRFESGAT